MSWVFFFDSCCEVKKNDFGCDLYFSAGLIRFTSKYGGKTVTGLVGSSVNFTWSFSFDVYVVDKVDWGLKKDGVNGFEYNGRLVSLDNRGSVSVTAPSAYNGRVSGSGDVFSGYVIFTLSSIRKSDQIKENLKKVGPTFFKFT